MVKEECMASNDNFTFDIAIGDKRVIDKNTFKWSSVHYTTNTVNVDTLIDKVRNGYPFNSVMTTNSFSAKEKKQSNFKQTSVIPFDIDKCESTFEEFYNKTELLPTFAYTTPNDGIKGNRFRFVYVLSEPVTSIEEYQAIYTSISSKLGIDTDNNLSSGVQNIGGMSEIGRLKISHYIYNKKDFISNNYFLNNKNILGKCAFKNNNKREKRADGIILNCTFEKDLNDLDFNQFLMKYRTEYEYFVNTPLKFNNGYALIPDDYYEIKRKWVNNVYETNSGTKMEKSIHRLKDGEGRRDKMFVQCLIRRKIKPDISLEELVFNLVCERQWYFDNSDNVLNNKELVRIARNSLDVEEITIPPTVTDKKFVVDREYWSAYGYNANQAKQMIKKMMKDDEIGNLYDPSLTDKENLEVFNRYNVKCSKRTLAKWKKDNGLTREYNKKDKE